MKAANHCRLEILHRFKKHEKYLLILLKHKFNGNEQTFDHILSSSDNKSLQFILNASTLNAEHKMDLFRNKLNQNGLLSIHIALSNKDIASEIINHFKSNKTELIELLCLENESGQTPIMYIQDIVSPKLILNDSVLSHEEIIQLILKRDNESKHWLYHQSGNDMNTGTQIACNILNYLKQKEDTETILKLLSTPTINECLILAIKRNKILLIETIIRCINILDDQSQRMLFLESSFIFNVENAKQLKTIFSSIRNNDILLSLLCQRNESQQTLHEKIQFDIMRDGTFHRPNKFKMELLAFQCLEYLQFDQLLNNKTEIDISFNEYDTNPFIMSCALGKRETVFKLFNYINNENKKLMEPLLLNSHSERSGNNCIMMLIENGYYEITMEILQFLDEHKFTELKLKLISAKNQLSGESMLISLCKNDDCFEIICKILNNIGDKSVVLQLLNRKDDKNRTFFDYAKPNIKKYIKQTFE